MTKKDRIRERQLNIRLTDSEYDNIKAKAEYCGLTISDFLRKQIRDGVIIKYDRFDIKELSNELNKIGVNINQIARHINEKGGEFDKQDMDVLVKEFQNMQAIIYGTVWGIR